MFHPHSTRTRNGSVTRPRSREHNAKNETFCGGQQLKEPRGRLLLGIQAQVEKLVLIKAGIHTRKCFIMAAVRPDEQGKSSLQSIAF